MRTQRRIDPGVEQAEAMALMTDLLGGLLGGVPGTIGTLTPGGVAPGAEGALTDLLDGVVDDLVDGVVDEVDIDLGLDLDGDLDVGLGPDMSRGLLPSAGLGLTADVPRLKLPVVPPMDESVEVLGLAGVDVELDPDMKLHTLLTLA